MEPKGPERIGEVISRLFAARGWGRQQERLKLETVWNEAAGPEYVAVTRVVGFRRNLLEIEVKGAVPLQELSQFHKRRILAKLRLLLPTTTISDLRFKATTW
jgi:hypothetical protein